jgi:steroid delta-isomerase-like uncharacterized protein
MAMDPITLCNRYFRAWMHRDMAAIAATFAPGGTYSDPTTPGPIGGDALREHVDRLWAAFPDLTFELGPVHGIGDSQGHAQWTMKGSNVGSLNGLPPTGKAIRLDGIDLFELGADGIRSVRGFFDSATLARQLGLDVIVQPPQIGPFLFGTSTVVRAGRPAAPGVVAVTELVADSDAAVRSVRDLSRQTVIESLQSPGFLWFTSATAGRRMTTVSMWDSADSMHAAMASGTHAQAMRSFGEFASAGVTSVFTPQRIGPYLQRCDACGRIARLAERAGACECRASLRAAV